MDRKWLNRRGDIKLETKLCHTILNSDLYYYYILTFAEDAKFRNARSRCGNAGNWRDVSLGYFAS